MVSERLLHHGGESMAQNRSHAARKQGEGNAVFILALLSARDGATHTHRGVFALRLVLSGTLMCALPVSLLQDSTQDDQES